mmetsp:Transcript_104354/g.207231  ORF Transcript_104354/g.207231 Transcript_104354/m.207231 type:complete len:506 (+) Transcript_104354:104-1621(+)
MALKTVFALMLFATISGASEIVLTMFRGRSRVKRCTVGDAQKMICGFPGINESRCMALGCCFTSSQSAAWPQCFQAKEEEESCSLLPGQESECGTQTLDPLGIACKSQGCCFVSNGPNGSAMCLRKRSRKQSRPTLPLAAPTCKVPEATRRACGTQEVTPKQCLDHGCCYYKTYAQGSVAPWCYFAGWEAATPHGVTIQDPETSHAVISEGIAAVPGSSEASVEIVTRAPVNLTAEPNSTPSVLSTTEPVGDVSRSRVGMSKSNMLRITVAKSVDDMANSTVTTTVEHAVSFNISSKTTTRGGYATMNANSVTNTVTTTTTPPATVSTSGTMVIATTATTTTTSTTIGSRPLLTMPPVITISTTSTTSTTTHAANASAASTASAPATNASVAQDSATNDPLTSNSLLALIPDIHDEKAMRSIWVLTSLSILAVSTTTILAVLFCFCRSGPPPVQTYDPSDAMQDSRQGIFEETHEQPQFIQSSKWDPRGEGYLPAGPMVDGRSGP